MSTMNPHENGIPGVAFSPADVNNSPVTGPAIVTPWGCGRFVAFTLMAGALGASDNLIVGIEARRKGTSTWDTVMEDDGVTPLAFDAITDGGAAENGHVFGTLAVDRLTSGKNLDAQYEYDAIRLNAVNTNAANVTLCASFYISALRDLPARYLSDHSLVKDQLYFKQTPHTENPDAV